MTEVNKIPQSYQNFMSEHESLRTIVELQKKSNPTKLDVIDFYKAIYGFSAVTQVYLLLKNAKEKKDIFLQPSDKHIQEEKDFAEYSKNISDMIENAIGKKLRTEVDHKILDGRLELEYVATHELLSHDTAVQSLITNLEEIGIPSMVKDWEVVSSETNLDKLIDECENNPTSIFKAYNEL